MSNRKIATQAASVASAASARHRETATERAPAVVGLPMQHGRHLALVASGADDLVEVRGSGGVLELRIRMTAEGPVLQMESLKLSLKAARDVEVQCATFSVAAREALTLQAEGEVRVQGQMIRLN